MAPDTHTHCDVFAALGWWIKSVWFNTRLLLIAVGCCKRINSRSGRKALNSNVFFSCAPWQLSTEKKTQCRLSVSTTTIKWRALTHAHTLKNAVMLQDDSLAAMALRRPSQDCALLRSLGCRPLGSVGWSPRGRCQGLAASARRRSPPPQKLLGQGRRRRRGGTTNH